jgi:hypothetical protein
MQPPLELLSYLLESIPPKLGRLSEAGAAFKPSAEKWSPKEELGHLLDSAVNNHQRIVRTLLEDEPSMPGYDQKRWVQLHAYQQRSWGELIELWETLNRQLFVAASAVTDADWLRTCRIAGSQPATLKFVLEDYLAHMGHHLAHIEEVGHMADGEQRKTNN